MNVIFLTMVQMSSLSERGIYQDLLRYFVGQGHKVYVVFPHERRQGKPTEVFEQDGAIFLGVRTMNLTKTNVVEKGVGQVRVESQFKNAIRKFWPNEHFDLILYSTPPITLMGTVKYLKGRNPQAKSYLLLKDIFPQNAVDIGMMSETGVKGLLYRYFRKQEEELYKVSDYIGCMSPANVKYVIEHNPEVNPEKIELAPNSYERNEETILAEEERKAIRLRYNLPIGRPIFIYGGNLGKPQGIPFLIKCLNANANRMDCHILVIGTGTELPSLKAWYEENNPCSVTVMNGLPKVDYDQLVKACDAGLIFLDHRFTIPNYPSRLLSYLENKMPVLCATDPNCDMGSIAEKNGYGYWCESNSVEAFTAILDKMIHSDIKAMGEKGYEFLCKNYLVENTYNAIMRHFES